MRESAYVIEMLIKHAEQHGYATSADVLPDPNEELFAMSTLPGPVYAHNTINSRPEDLTLNGVDIRYLVEQHDRMLDQLRAEAE